MENTISNTKPIFIGYPFTAVVVINSANAARDGSGSISTLVTASISGTHIDRIRVQSFYDSENSPDVVRIFHSNDSGSTIHLAYEILIPDTIPGTTIEAPSAELVRTDGLPLFDMSSTEILYCSTDQGYTYNVFAYGGNY